MEERERKTQELLHSKDHELQTRKKGGSAWGKSGSQVLVQNASMEKVHKFGSAFEMIQQATGDPVKL